MIYHAIVLDNSKYKDTGKILISIPEFVMHSFNWDLSYYPEEIENAYNKEGKPVALEARVYSRSGGGSNFGEFIFPEINQKGLAIVLNNDFSKIYWMGSFAEEVIDESGNFIGTTMPSSEENKEGSIIFADVAKEQANNYIYRTKKTILTSEKSGQFKALNWEYRPTTNIINFGDEVYSVKHYGNGQLNFTMLDQEDEKNPYQYVETLSKASLLMDANNNIILRSENKINGTKAEKPDDPSVNELKDFTEYKITPSDFSLSNKIFNKDYASNYNVFSITKDLNILAKTNYKEDSEDILFTSVFSQAIDSFTFSLEDVENKITLNNKITLTGNTFNITDESNKKSADYKYDLSGMTFVYTNDKKISTLDLTGPITINLEDNGKSYQIVISSSGIQINADQKDVSITGKNIKFLADNVMYGDGTDYYVLSAKLKEILDALFNHGHITNTGATQGPAMVSGSNPTPLAAQMTSKVMAMGSKK